VKPKLKAMWVILTMSLCFISVLGADAKDIGWVTKLLQQI